MFSLRQRESVEIILKVSLLLCQWCRFGCERVPLRTATTYANEMFSYTFVIIWKRSVYLYFIIIAPRRNMREKMFAFCFLCRLKMNNVKLWGALLMNIHHLKSFIEGCSTIADARSQINLSAQNMDFSNRHFVWTQQDAGVELRDKRRNLKQRRESWKFWTLIYQIKYWKFRSPRAIPAAFATNHFRWE